jgi:predicted  nucleic acid-binding Zn-ribbon protein
LDVQELDSRLDQLQHQLDTMPETKELQALSAGRAELDGRVRDAQIRVDDLTREQKKADADVEQVKSRRVRDQDRMDQGLITNPKDLERMQQEMVSLQRRISSLEDTELEVMEQLENAQAELTDLTSQLADTDERVRATTTSRDEKAAGIHEQTKATSEERKVLASSVPEDLMTLYAKLRKQKGGVGVGALLARRCTGCGMVLNASDLGVIAKSPFDAVIRCEECDRILVRTSESGV